MFGEQFYPTPKEVISKLIEPIVVENTESRKNSSKKSIPERIFLEPSAGKGDILDYIKEKYAQHCKLNAYCIEIDPNLIHILHGKGYQVIGNDFLTTRPTNYFDTILMNPPFAYGAEHVLHAWDILESGEIHAILNKETIDNPYSSKRKALIAIIEAHGSVEHIGRAFIDAEVKADVSCSIVRLYKKAAKKRLYWEPKEFKQAKVVDFGDANLINDKVALNDQVETMIIQTEQLRTAMVSLIKSNQAVSFYSKGLMKLGSEKLMTILQEKSAELQYNAFNDSLKTSIWMEMLNKSKVSEYMTSNVQKNWQQFVASTGSMEISKENVYKVIEMIFMNRHEIMKQAVVDVFDLFTKYSEENKMVVESWKTNSCWKINKKIIVPWVVRYGEYMNQHSIKQNGDKFSINYHKSQDFWDIDKVMCYLSGKSDSVTIEEALKDRFHIIGTVRPGDKFDNELESTFFKIKFWKKGTIHITFKDDKLWDLLNMIACDMKNWLPPEEKKKWKEREKTETPQPNQNQLLLSQ